MDFERRLVELDWRLVDAFDLQQIDAVLLQEMVPSVAFGLVTEPMCTSPRLACKLICILQLIVEMFIGCRKHDAYDVQQLQDELTAALDQRNTYRLRLKEAATDTKALKAQLTRTTTLLKSCGHVLHAHGCSPHAIAALEAMLATPLANNIDANVKVAHLCAFCGKAFGTQEYLLKHIERRHPGGSPTDQPTEMEPNVVYGKTRPAKPAFTDYQALLSKLESMLSQHEVSIRAVAADETAKLKAMQTELKVETGIKTELDVARAAVTARLDDARRQLTQVVQERDEVMNQLVELKDEITLLKQKRAMQPPPTEVVVTVPDVKDRLTIERLEAIVEHSKGALALARQDLKEVHDKYDALLVHHERGKCELAAAQADLAKALYQAQKVSAVVAKATATAQSQTRAVDARDMGAQTEPEPVPELTVIQSPAATVKDTPPPEPAPAPIPIAKSVIHAFSQTDALEAPSMTLTPPQKPQEEPIAIPTPVMAPVAAPDFAPVLAPAPPALSPLVAQAPPQKPPVHLPPELIAAKVEDALQTIFDRADMHASTPYATRTHELARRPFLKSTWPHEAAAVDARIQVHLAQLDRTSERFGVGRVATTLAAPEHTVATTALKAHLHVLPVAALKRMVAIDAMVQSLLVREWVPTEQSRHEALAAIKARVDGQDAAQEHWVAQVLGLNKGGADSLRHPIPTLGDPIASTLPTMQRDV
ncbi:hypothetical protein ACHHYP_07223 [Achlya hypogyna]|uniref:C2H2-type domain-containing protein n=1 Tax=Achlya hypogyna TaxID=1202772 RepID=A0A1V9ZML7_ACHHY|nr:hypothetical protein ACHHYP_07223 [Achlya hypogyna]